MNQALNDFLTDAGMHADVYDFESGVRHFQEAMTDGLERKDGALRMLPTFVGVPDHIQPHSKVLVIDLGGTNLRTGLIAFDGSARASVIEIRKRKMPGLKEAATRDDVFDAIASLSVDWLDAVEHVGFCFSNAFEFQDDGDARVLHFGKELRVEGMVGCLLIANLRDAWKRAGSFRQVQVTVLNDTVSTLLMSKLLYPQRQASGYLGFILGTGTNISYLESNANISKLSGLNPCLHQVINIESGDYGGFRRTVFDDLLDASTVNAGHYHAEKMVSGAFVGRLIRIVIGEAHRAGLIEADVAGDLTTKHVNDFLLDLREDGNPLFALTDSHPATRSGLFQLMDTVLERCAKMVAITLVATVRKMEPVAPFETPVMLSIDGSSYAGEYFYRERIEYYLRRELTEKEGIHYQIVRPVNASLLGASVAALGSQFGR